MGGEVGKVYSLPPLPAGECLFSSLPARAIVLHALAPALGDSIVTLVDGECTAVLVVRDGAIADAVSIVRGTRNTGEAALAHLRSWDSASASCTRLSDEAMSLLGPLLHGELVYSDLRLEWTSWSQLLDDLRMRGQTFVVELQTPTERGVTVIRGGQQVATYTDARPALGGPEMLDPLAMGGHGAVRVFAEATEPKRVDAPPAQPAVSVAPATRVPDALSLLDGVAAAVPPLDRDDTNATLSSLFGQPETTDSFARTVVIDRSGSLADGDVRSLVPELKLLSQRRLRRSSSPVEDAVDRAVDENRGIDWLVTRVRAMRVRGFVPETFEHLAEEMQALVRKP
jgi:hypothetical protein